MHTSSSAPGAVHRARYALAALALLAVPAAAGAQDRSFNVTLQGIPSATVAPSGLVFASIATASERTGDGDGADGSAALGFGVGNAEEALGAQVTAHLTSLTDDFADSGYFEFKVSRRIAAGSTLLYLGASVTAGGYGDADDRDNAVRLMLTGFQAMRFAASGPSYPIMFTLGAGSNERDNETDPGIFAGVGIGLNDNFGVSAAWSGEYVNIGTAYRFDNNDNIQLAATVYDLFDQEDSRRVGVSFTYLFKDLF